MTRSTIIATSLLTVLIIMTSCGESMAESKNNNDITAVAKDTEGDSDLVEEKSAAQVEKSEDLKGEENITGLKNIEQIPDGEWQVEKSFPDQAGYVDNTLAINSMYSFEGFSGQGKLYFEVQDGIESFDLFVNNRAIDTTGVTGGFYELDISDFTLNGTNSIQVSSVITNNAENKVTVKIPYPTVIEGTLDEVGIDEKPLELIDKIIQSDVDNGFTSAQLAIIKDGRLVYQNAWGVLNSYDQEGNRIENGEPVTNDTLYDLASNTKMYSVAYAMQYLIDRGDISLDTKVTDVFGDEFVDDTLEIDFASFEGNYPGLDTIKEWKSRITVKNLLMHQAGFPDSGHYIYDKYDTANQKISFDVDNVLFIENADKEKTFKEGICRTPLINEPGTTTMYSDIDYMLLGLIIEKTTGKDLDTFLKETYWEPMGLEHITYCPLENGFEKSDCAATELNGNTRDGLLDFPGTRTGIIQGEVHDEHSYYTMEGVSGHAGLFASATDLAKLANVMLTGGYDNHAFFSKNTRDLFIAPQAGCTPTYGIGWWRQADNKRMWYFGLQAPDSTVGHQGWTGTLSMIDFENNMVIVYLTNSINSPIFEPSLENANRFYGKYYTASTLGFVPQILYMGIGNTEDCGKALDSLVKDMATGKQKLVEQEEEKLGEKLSEDHPMRKALKSIQEVAERMAE